ncbi:MAG TPA: hypothetical protein VFC98_01520 [Clostridia bacterium]|nr:hypothetical protein [Clostridia bacterium]
MRLPQIIHFRLTEDGIELLDDGNNMVVEYMQDFEEFLAGV